jgi:NADH-quinone oxidoreductase subunit M
MIQIYLFKFSLNNLDILFIIVGVFLNLLTLISASVYLKERKLLFYIINFVYLIAFIMLIITKTWFVFLIAWELVTITTSLMLLWSKRKLSIQYFILQFIGSAILIFAIITAGKMGYVNIGPITENWLQNLFIIALGMKSAIFGLHFWLAPVHSGAPAPVSGILSGWVVKLGFITYIKIIPEGNNLLLFLGIIMIIYGAYKALQFTDYKVILAYSTISNLGYIGLGIGAGTELAILGSIYHIIIHGFAKTVLFIGSAYWEKEYNTREIYDFKYAYLRKPLNSIVTAFSILSLMGFAFFPSYYSKYLIKHSLSVLPVVVLHIASIITYLYSIRILYWAVVRDMYTGLIDRLNRKDNIYKLKINFLMNFRHKLPLYAGTIPLIIILVWPEIIFSIMGIANIKLEFFGIKSILLNTLIFFFAIALFYLNKGFKFENRRDISLDSYFIFFYKLINKTASVLYRLLDTERLFDASYKLINRMAPVLYKLLDTEKLFDVLFLRFLINLCRSLYKSIYLSFQFQLIWIPLFFLFLLVWVRLAIENIL